MDYVYRCKKCGQTFDFKTAGHSIEIIENGKKMLQACRGELEKLELMAEIPLLKTELLNGGQKAN